MCVRTLVFTATACAGAMLPLVAQAETAISQEGISDANGPNAAYDMEVGYLTSGFGGVLGPSDANHQIGGLATNWGRVLLHGISARSLGRVMLRRPAQRSRSIPLCELKASPTFLQSFLIDFIVSLMQTKAGSIRRFIATKLLRANLGPAPTD